MLNKNNLVKNNKNNLVILFTAMYFSCSVSADNIASD